MVKFYGCKKCGYQFVGQVDLPRTFKCGAIAEYVHAEDSSVGNDGIFQAVGIKPLGCGGEIKELTQEEAMKNVRK